MFDFFSMAGTYEERKVALYNEGGLVISTAMVTDGDLDFETAIKHPDYNDGNFVIVEAYDSLSDAHEGHERWVEIMTAEPLPDALRDCQNSSVSKFLDPEDMKFPRKR
jgi:hypothetical protein